jgi:hypothetical protein
MFQYFILISHFNWLLSTLKLQEPVVALQSTDASAGRQKKLRYVSVSRQDIGQEDEHKCVLSMSAQYEKALSGRPFLAAVHLS